MSHIHFPPECANDPVIGPLMPPMNEAQRETHENAELAQQKYAETGCFLSDATAMHVGHNLFVCGRKFMPFSVIAGPEIVMEPYNKWQGYEYLIIVNNSAGTVDYVCNYIGSRYQLEDALLDRLLLFRRYRVQAVHPLDTVALDAAIAECIHQIDKQRMRQRKQRETAR